MPSPFVEIIEKIGANETIEAIEALREIVSTSYPKFFGEVIALYATQNKIEEDTLDRVWTPGFETPPAIKLIGT